MTILTMAEIIVQIKSNAALLHQWLTGASDEEITVSAGSYPTLAKIIADNLIRLNLLNLVNKAGITIPAGTTIEREAAPEVARFRYNSNLEAFEGFTPVGWLPLTNAILKLYYGSVPIVSGTTLIPYGNTTPLITEGTQIWSKTVASISSASSFIINFTGLIDSGTSNRYITLAIFRDTVFIGVVSAYFKANNSPVPISIEVIDLAPAKGVDVTYSARMGLSAGGSWYLGKTSTASFGNINSSNWKIQEVL